MEPKFLIASPLVSSPINIIEKLMQVKLLEKKRFEKDQNSPLGLLSKRTSLAKKDEKPHNQA